jgi:hypothetical protein
MEREGCSRGLPWRGTGFWGRVENPPTPNGELKVFERRYEKAKRGGAGTSFKWKSCVRFATASCVALTLLASLVEPAGSHPPLSLRERDKLGDLLAERAGFEPVSKTGFPLKRGAKFALETALIRLFATRLATIAEAGI